MIYLFENETITDKKLREAIEANRSLHDYFESGFDGPKPKNVCGFLSVESESYFIVPKIVEKPNAQETNLDIFIYMLLYTYDIQLKNEDLQRGKNVEQRLFEIFIRLFADNLLNELKRAVFRQFKAVISGHPTLFAFHYTLFTQKGFL